MGLAAGEGEGWDPPFLVVICMLSVRRKGKECGDQIRGAWGDYVSEQDTRVQKKKGARCLPGPVLDLYPAASWGASQEREERALDLAGQAAVPCEYEDERQ